MAATFSSSRLLATILAEKREDVVGMAFRPDNYYDAGAVVDEAVALMIKKNTPSGGKVYLVSEMLSVAAKEHITVPAFPNNRAELIFPFVQFYLKNYK